MVNKYKKNKSAPQSITINDVPPEYVALFKSLVGVFPYLHQRQRHTPNATSSMSKSRIRTLFFCEAVHRMSEEELGAGSGDRRLAEFRARQDRAGVEYDP